ncbi:hypothetical protein LB543_27975 [Mesorhizobium sp. ESP7-2]|uniref:hypothetical protein n=1 Tax=Mesorhizobium sp. ESP7-2 TaxID=2876622 RepID=UPI001CCDFBE7|nr:hypothetical protein [Mesorhizobium sp. ESP7-2]MBZ9710540.1 hypothetical protein [Mesorhizobium sp. ESP7-2]
MTATTIKQTESVPEAYPVRPDGLSAAAAAIDPDVIWQRIEAYVAYRWSERDVEWIVEGCGDWSPPLAPATIATVEIWQGDAWETVTLSPSAVGGYCLRGGTYRFAGTVGGDVPAAVLEAFRRLAEYMAADTGNPGATSERIEIPGVQTTEISRSAPWMARAMQNSGAGDLLRAYRRA